MTSPFWLLSVHLLLPALCDVTRDKNVTHSHTRVRRARAVLFVSLAVA